MFWDSNKEKLDGSESDLRFYNIFRFSYIKYSTLSSQYSDYDYSQPEIIFVNFKSYLLFKLSIGRSRRRTCVLFLVYLNGPRHNALRAFDLVALLV